MAKKKQKKKKAPPKNKQLTQLMEAVRAGYPHAQTILGVYYMNGEMVKENKEKGFSLFLQASKQGDIEALYHLGLCYMYGDGCEVDYHLAKQYLNRAQLAGMKEAYTAMYDLEQMFIEREHERMTYLDANDLYDQGNQAGTLKYAQCLIDGVGVNADPERGKEIMMKLADEGYEEAQYELGNIFLYDEDHQNIDRGLYYLEAAGKQGHAKALHNLGAYYINHWEHHQGLPYLKQAAALNNPLSCEMLATYYYYGSHFERDLEQAFQYMMQALSLPSEDVDPDKVAQWAKDPIMTPEQMFHLVEAASIYSRTCRMRLGFYYLQGYGTKRDIAQGLQILRDLPEVSEDLRAFLGRISHHDDPVASLQQACARGRKEAMYELACCYYHGIFVPSDTDEAVSWFQRAADAHCVPALSVLGEMYVRGWCVVKDVEKGLSMLKEAAGYNDLYAIDLLNHMYQKGYGVEADEKQAKVYQEMLEIGKMSDDINIKIKPHLF